MESQINTLENQLEEANANLKLNASNCEGAEKKLAAAEQLLAETKSKLQVNEKRLAMLDDKHNTTELDRAGLLQELKKFKDQAATPGQIDVVAQGKAKVKILALRTENKELQAQLQLMNDEYNKTLNENMAAMQATKRTLQQEFEEAQQQFDLKKEATNAAFDAREAELSERERLVRIRIA